MKVKVSKTAGFDTRIVFALKGEKNLPKDFEADAGKVFVWYKKDLTLIYCGLGEEKDLTTRTLRGGAAAGVRKAAELKRRKISIIEPTLKRFKEEAGEACIVGATLGAYVFGRFKSEKPDEVEIVEIVSGGGLSARKARRTVEVCESVRYARDLVNDNASVIYPERLAREARKIARGNRAFRCTVLGQKEIRQRGLGLLEAVGQGSPFPPRLIILEYQGAPGSKKRPAVVGKGITFDSGGQNLKPSGHIESMRQDMAGAAAVLGTMRTLAVTAPKINVVGVIAAAHNAIGNTSYFPGDVYKSFSGKTVEITNTDAEGRLVLADAISYVQKHHRPTEILDLATLTGAILVALGDSYAGLFSDDDRMAEALIAAGEKTGDRLWRLPVEAEHAEAMRSDVADLRNTSKLPKGHAGSITGAAFLKAFVEGIPWAHIDIAGTAWNDREPRGEVPRFGTGFGVQLLVEYLSA